MPPDILTSLPTKCNALFSLTVYPSLSCFFGGGFVSSVIQCTWMVSKIFREFKSCMQWLAPRLQFHWSILSCDAYSDHTVWVSVLFLFRWWRGRPYYFASLDFHMVYRWYWTGVGVLVHLRVWMLELTWEVCCMWVCFSSHAYVSNCLHGTRW